MDLYTPIAQQIGVVMSKHQAKDALDGATSNLANSIKHAGIKTFGMLPLSGGVELCDGAVNVRSESRGIALRMVSDYDIGFDRMMVRIDVLGTST